MVIPPDLLITGTTEALLFTLIGSVPQVLITVALTIHIIKTARPKAGGGR